MNIYEKIVFSCGILGVMGMVLIPLCATLFEEFFRKNESTLEIIFMTFYLVLSFLLLTMGVAGS